MFTNSQKQQTKAKLKQNFRLHLKMSKQVSVVDNIYGSHQAHAWYTQTEGKDDVEFPVMYLGKHCKVISKQYARKMKVGSASMLLISTKSVGRAPHYRPRCLLIQERYKKRNISGQKRNNLWGLPGGQVDAGEKDPVEAAMREFEEEVGFDLETYFPGVPCMYVLREHPYGNSLFVVYVTDQKLPTYLGHAADGECTDVAEVGSWSLCKALGGEKVTKHGFANNMVGLTHSFLNDFFQKFEF